jgi:hypothetical protein
MRTMTFVTCVLTGTLFGATYTFAQQANDLERDAKALELFLQDKEDHKEHCPRLKWNQPKLEVYKKELKSQLPKGCKK